MITLDGISHNQSLKRLRILFLTKWYPSLENPIKGVFIQEIARAVSVFHSVIVIHNMGGDPTLDQPWKLDLEEDSSLTKGIKTYRFRYRPSPVPGTRLIFSALALSQAYRQKIRVDWIPDIIHAHVFQAGIWGVMIGALNRIPVVITEHSSAFIRNRLSRSARYMASIAFRIAKIIVPVSTALKDAMIQNGITGNMQVIPNVVDGEVFSFKPKSQRKQKLRFIYVGLLDLSDNKGLPILFEALKMFAERDANWQLDIIGDGPGRRKYQELVSEYHLMDFVVFHGMKTKSEVANFMAEADLFILPSIKETFSVVTAEALATGTPVLVTKCGGPEDYVNQTNGILVEAGDPGALYEGLLRSIESLDSYDNEQIASDARQRFSPAVIGEEYTKIYHGILSGFQE